MSNLNEEFEIILEEFEEFEDFGFCEDIF